ncbi:MAG: hypothetical protein ACJ8ED_04840 [Xanthobacteraceae bacterium]
MIELKGCLLIELLGTVGVLSLLGPVVLDLHEGVENAGPGGLDLAGLKDGVVNHAQTTGCGEIEIGRSWRIGRH